MREYLEKKYEDSQPKLSEERHVVKLAVAALMEVVQGRENNMEVAICRKDKPYEVSSNPTICIVFFSFIKLVLCVEFFMKD